MCGQIQTLKSHPKQAGPGGWLLPIRAPTCATADTRADRRGQRARTAIRGKGEKHHRKRRATPNPGTPMPTPTPLNKQNHLGLWGSAARLDRRSRPAGRRASARDRPRRHAQ
jgi:hypothetical protein